MVDFEGVFTADAISSPNDLGLQILGHAVVQDDVGGLLEIDTSTVGDTVDKEDVDVSFFEFMDFFLTGFHGSRDLSKLDAIVVEGVVEPLAVEITRAVPCPTIGIGASAQCDGQVLVTDDMLGMFERTPRFVKIYENLAETISAAAATYASEVRARTFPGVEQTYQPTACLTA